MGAHHPRRSFFLMITIVLSFIPSMINQVVVVGQQTTTTSLATALSGDTLRSGNATATSTTSSAVPPTLSVLPQSPPPPLIPAAQAFPFPLPSGVPLTASGKPVPCSPKNTKLNPSTHKLISECTPQAFCLAPPGAPANATGLGVCVPRRCRRDEFPYGYARFGGTTNASSLVPRVRMLKGQKLVQVGDDDPILQRQLPPMCTGRSRRRPGSSERGSSFCPDNGSGCRPTVVLGGQCELGRDEQCQLPPPPNDQDLNLPVGSVNRAVCLNSKCVHAIETLDAPCTIENTTYVSDINKGLAGGGQFSAFVFKHNCLSPFFFCDAMAYDSSQNSATCQKTLRIGQGCSFDAQCMTGNCDGTICSPPAGTTVLLASWHWAATITFIIISLIAAMVTLSYIHRKRRYAHYKEVQDYYVEQMHYRRSIHALRAAAPQKHTEKVDLTVPKEKE